MAAWTSPDHSRGSAWLKHDGFVDPRIEILPIRDINQFLCSTPVDFDLLGESDSA